jgi:3-hydroxyacyl-[acyl-carrier-protein] dehydratase
MNDLYDIVPRADEGLFGVRLNPGHPIFSGHFPDRPVLPGICSLIVIRRCAELFRGRTLVFSAIRESKFLATITPEAELTVRLQLTEEAGEYSLTAEIRKEETVMLKLKATLAYE